MKTSLIICTYMRPGPLNRLLESVYTQTYLPDEVLIVDGSTNNETETLFLNSNYKNLKYFKVSAQDRGLTRQRNYGIKRVFGDCEIVCFLDDDTLLKPDYFEQLLSTYQSHPDALGVGGLIVNEVRWEQVGDNYHPRLNEYVFDG